MRFTKTERIGHRGEEWLSVIENKGVVLRERGEE